jgi:hypothetical protein
VLSLGYFRGTLPVRLGLAAVCPVLHDGLDRNLMQIRYADGRVRDGMMLTLKGSVARLAIENEVDVVEFRLVQDQWISEDCEPVAFEYPLAMFRSMEAPAAAKPAPRLPENSTVPSPQYVN